MTRSDRSAMQERILETADRLFYGQGIRAVGVDTIAAEVGISKRTLYNYFPSKDELIVAYLSRRLRPTPPSDLPPELQILGDGAIAAALVRGDPKVAVAAGDAARVLLKTAGVKLPAVARRSARR